MPELLVQIQSFFFTLVLGMLAGLIFHYYQLTINKARVGKFPLYILDFFLWIIMICMVFFCMLWINQGEMRIYVLIALFAGILIYYYYISFRLQKAVDKTAEVTINIVIAVKNSIKKPIIWLINKIKNMINNRNAPPPDGKEQ